MSEPTDAALLAALGQSRDRDAFRTLFRRWSPRLRSWALRQQPDPALADEVVQDIFLRLWRHAASYDPRRAAPETWIFTVARNARVDRLRRDRRSWLEWRDADAPTEPDKSPLRFAEAAIDGARVRQALADLPPDQRDVLMRAYFDGATLSEVADQVGTPLGTVKSRVRLGLERLRDALRSRP